MYGCIKFECENQKDDGSCVYEDEVVKSACILCELNKQCCRCKKKEQCSKAILYQKGD